MCLHLAPETVPLHWHLPQLTVLFVAHGSFTSTSGDAIWDRTLIGTVSEKFIFCFDSMMLLLHMVL